MTAIAKRPDWLDGPGGRFFGPDGELKRRGGRPTTLTPDVARAILANVLECGKVRISVECEGIPWKTYTSWIDQAALGKEPFATFSEAMLAARAEWARRQVEKVHDAPDWQSKAWLLERMNQEGFEKPLRVQHDHRHEILPPQPIDARPVIDAESRVLAEIGEGHGQTE